MVDSAALDNLFSLNHIISLSFLRVSLQSFDIRPPKSVLSSNNNNNISILFCYTTVLSRTTARNISLSILS